MPMEKIQFSAKTNNQQQLKKTSRNKTTIYNRNICDTLENLAVNMISF